MAVSSRLVHEKCGRQRFHHVTAVQQLAFGEVHRDGVIGVGNCPPVREQTLVERDGVAQHRSDNGQVPRGHVIEVVAGRAWQGGSGGYDKAVDMRGEAVIRPVERDVLQLAFERRQEVRIGARLVEVRKRVEYGNPCLLYTSPSPRDS